MKPYPLEAEEQAALFLWARLMEERYPALRWMFHIPNGGSRHPAEAANLRRQGVRPGVADIFLPQPSGQYHGLFIEMKRRDGKLTKNQAEFLREMERRGYMAGVARSAESAQRAILSYLSGEMEAKY